MFSIIPILPYEAADYFVLRRQGNERSYPGRIGAENDNALDSGFSRRNQTNLKSSGNAIYVRFL
jgi:hypothetical protein